jgi:hypothetical protein
MAEERADHRIGIDQRHVRLAHDAQVDGEQRDHRQDRGEQVEDLEAHVEHGGHHAGRSPRRHGDQRRKPGIDARDDQHRGDGRAERERAIDRQIRKIEDAECEVDAERDEGIDQPQLHGSPECNLTQGCCPFVFCPAWRGRKRVSVIGRPRPT